MRDQIVEAMKWPTSPNRTSRRSGELTHAAGRQRRRQKLPAADRIVGNLVSAVTVEQGAVHVTFGNQANGAIKGKTLTLRPRWEDAPLVPVAWVCAGASRRRR